MNRRVEKVKWLRLCFNCLRSGHPVKFYNSSAYQKCYGNHHTLIHFEKSLNPESADYIVKNEYSSSTRK